MGKNSKLGQKVGVRLHNFYCRYFMDFLRNYLKLRIQKLFWMAWLQFGVTNFKAFIKVLFWGNFLKKTCPLLICSSKPRNQQNQNSMCNVLPHNLHQNLSNREDHILNCISHCGSRNFRISVPISQKVHSVPARPFASLRT